MYLHLEQGRLVAFTRWSTHECNQEGVPRGGDQECPMTCFDSAICDGINRDFILMGS